MFTPLNITVVIPLYNKAHTIIDTLESVILQSRPADEIVIIDDGSSDGSVERLETYLREQQSSGQAFDWKKIRLARQENQGVSAARNHGIELARGNYIAFLDADDAWLPQYLEQIERLYVENQGCPVLATAYQYELADNEYRQARYRFDGPRRNYFAMVARGDLPFNSSSVCIAKTLLQELQGFPVGQRMGEDQELWQRAALCSKIAYSPLQLSLYRIDVADRACGSQPEQSECAYSLQLCELAERLPEHSLLRDELIACSVTHLRQLARLNLQSGHPATARKLLSKAFRRVKDSKTACYLAWATVAVWKQQAGTLLSVCSALFSASKTSTHKERLSELRYRRRWRQTLNQQEQY
ncbi:glycosyltransferase family 2 protein [Pseudoteredinibacter isoporae]|uniref:glycosyltransferase family 2 protein n=1 Tax=Pseudoteredinibacter isoporae TaxID=570281 RepID=UPI003106F928